MQWIVLLACIIVVLAMLGVSLMVRFILRQLLHAITEDDSHETATKQTDTAQK